MAARTVLLGVTLPDAERVQASSPALADAVLVSMLSLDRLRGMEVDRAFATPAAKAHPKFEQALPYIRVAMLATGRVGDAIRVC